MGTRHHSRDALVRRPEARLILCAAASTLLLGLMSLSGASTAGASSTGVVTIGVEGPMSGPQASTGIDMWRGASLMAQRINASGGLLGEKIKLIRLNDRADSTIAAATAHRAISEHVTAVIGPYNSSVGLVNLPIYLQAHVLVVRLTSNKMTSNMGITLQPMDYQVAPFEAAPVEKMAKPQRVAIVYDSSAYTSGVADQMQALLTAAGVQVVASEPVTSTQTKFATVLSKVKAANPTLVYYDAYDPQAEYLVKQAAAARVPGTCLVDGLAAQGPTFVATVPLRLTRKCIFSGVPTAMQFPSARSYVASYQRKYHRSPGTWGVFAYDSLGVLAHEVNAAHSLDYNTVNTALFHVTSYAGATGSTTIDPGTGDRDNPPLLMQTVNAKGRYVVSSTWAATGALPQLPSL